jgi:hypothetical protein
MDTVVTCNGRASWGYGREAARDATGSIARALTSAADLSTIVDIVVAASRRARAEFGIAGEDAPAFSVLVALVGESSIDLAWVGDVHASLERGSATVAQTEPHVFVEGDARVITRPLPGEHAWEREPFLERATWARAEGDRFVHG